jgi:hypothetical protein
MTDPSNAPSPIAPRKPAGEVAPRRRNSGRLVRISQRGLLSLVTTFIGFFTFSIAMAGITKLTADIFAEGLVEAAKGIWAKVIVIGLIYVFGWIVSVLGVRVFGNLVLPILIKIFAWVMLVWASALYVIVIQRLYLQVYDAFHYWAYLLMVASGLLALLGFHLILEGHDLRPFAIPLLIIAMFQLFIILVRYVFTSDVKPELLIYDIAFFVMMITISGLMVAHMGMLNPVRRFMLKFFDRNSHVIRPES